MKKSLITGLLLVIIICFSGYLSATEAVVVFEENDTAWQYSGYWRSSTQGQHGSGGRYAVGRASETGGDGFGGGVGFGAATLNLSALDAATARIELCYIAHGATYRDTATTLTIGTRAGDVPLVFSQRGTNNNRQCFDTGTHTAPLAVVLSNATPNDKWVALDFVRVTYDPSLNGSGLRSSYTADDLVPVGLMGTTLASEMVITGETLGLGTFDVANNFGLALAPLDDLDNNGVPEILATLSITNPENNTRAHMVILFLDHNRNLLRYQLVDNALLRGSGLPGAYQPRHIEAIGDFDSNGVRDVVISDGAQTSVFYLVRFGRTDDTVNASYTVEGTLMHANASGSLPFPLPVDVSLGAQVQPFGDIDGNGVMDFFTIPTDNSGNLARFLGFTPSNATRTAFLVQPGDDGIQSTVDFATISGNLQVAPDVNGDGIPEMIGPGFTIDSLSFNTSQNSFAYTTHPIPLTLDNVPFVRSTIHPVMDANGDGHMDVVLSGFKNRDSVNAIVGVVYLDGNLQALNEPVVLARASDHPDFSRAFRQSQIKVVDMDADGDLDLIIGHPTNPNGAALYLRYYN